MMSRLPFALIIVFSCVAPSAGADLTFEADVRPILKAHCFQCHGERETKEANLDLRLRRWIATGGDSGPAIVAGEVEQSLLIQRVAAGEMPPDEDKRVSQEELLVLRRWVAAGAITARAEPESLDGRPYFTEEERNWWSFRPLRKVTPPTDDVLARSARTPIDGFIASRLATSPNPQSETSSNLRRMEPIASRVTRIRRIYLDMLGVPPTPAEVDRFVGDKRPGAWNRLVDRVLASPRYGERWGRHWLDVAGYADSEGYTDEDRVRQHAWRYRDYVIRAFNQDRPYSEFLTEQLAGDELVGWPQSNLQPHMIDPLSATGFLRMAPDGTASGGIDQSLARNQVVADTMQIVGTAVLGLTLQCAQCHDHRYDPIPQRDYYQVRAIFEPALNWKNWQPPPQRLVSLYSGEDRAKRSAIEAKAKAVDVQRQKRVDFYIAKTLEHELLMVEDELQEPLRTAFQTKPSDRTAEQKSLLDNHINVAKITPGSLYLYDRRRSARAADLDRRREEKLAATLARLQQNALAALDEATRAEVATAAKTEPSARSDAQRQLLRTHPNAAPSEDMLAKLDSAAAAEQERYRAAAAEIRKFRIRDELQKLSDQAKALRDTIPTEHFLRILSEQPGKVPNTFVFHRGDHQQPKEAVQARGLSVLGRPPLAADDSFPAANDKLKTSGRRLRYARQLTDGKHPLVARVLVNRLWAHHFGRGIVATTGDFGALGDRPSHPELLDWLAAELVESGWSVKHVQRLILRSHVYQQSAVGRPAVVAADPDNRLLGRWPLRRLEAEILRDAILSVVGDLNARMYGEPVPVMEDEVGKIVLGKESLDGERKPTSAIPLKGEEFRRSIYVQVRRTRPLSLLESFDLPEATPNCTNRPASNVAPQALLLMNSDFMADVSRAFADRLVKERPDNRQNKCVGAGNSRSGSLPSAEQVVGFTEFLKRQSDAFRQDKVSDADVHRSALATYCQALLSSNRFLYVE